jgi:hypothetical protein
MTRGIAYGKEEFQQVELLLRAKAAKIRLLLTQLRSEMQYLHGQIEETDKLIARICAAPCRRALGDEQNQRSSRAHGHFDYAICHRSNLPAARS